MTQSLGDPSDRSVGSIVGSTERLTELVVAHRTIGAKIVLTQGTFDLIHIGHAKYMAMAKTHGDVLIVGVDSDAKVRTRKGPDRPIVPEDERIGMVCFLGSVDYAILKSDSPERWQLIKAVRPDVLIATSATYTEEELEDLNEFCGEVVVLEPMAETTTSAKIRRTQIEFAKKIGQTLTRTISEAVPGIVEATVNDMIEDDGGQRA